MRILGPRGPTPSLVFYLEDLCMRHTSISLLPPLPPPPGSVALPCQQGTVWALLRHSFSAVVASRVVAQESGREQDPRQPRLTALLSWSVPLLSRCVRSNAAVLAVRGAAP